MGNMEDELQKEVFICMYCKKECNVTEGSWPQKNDEQEDVMNSDLNNRSRCEFVCYDCID